MLYCIVSDIFGRTKPLEKLSEKLSPTCIIVDPYQGKTMDFVNEQWAYQYFIEHVGIDKYAEYLMQKLAVIEKPVKIIAFSVGGSAAWKISEQLSSQNIHSLTCFYASQIRHQIAIKPNVPVNLILPKFEAHFSITQLAELLKNKANVSLEKTDYLHGFMNELSLNYDENGYRNYARMLASSSI